MEVIDYYYKILNVNYDAEIEEVIEAYSNKIKKYSKLPFLNENQKTEVKELKKAYYILSNNDLRKVYDNIIIQEIETHNKFKDNNNEKPSILKKEKLDSTIMSDRVFSMIGILNPPQRNLDIDRNFLSSKNN
jgi:DnaJ-class molecular chaperone